jgi:hypothetical protein
MTIHHQIPEAADFARLTGDFDSAVTIYLATSPNPAREQARVAFKSALDGAARELADPAGVVAQGQEILADEQLWGSLSRSLAVFLSDTSTELYVLPNRLDDQVVVGTHFELGPLWRSVTQQQEALALTLSADAWQLWHATPGSRIAPVELSGDHPADAGKATQRASAGRGDDRLGGDPYDLYAKRVADAASAELAAIDPDNRLTLFVFGDERLMHLFAERKSGRRIVGLAGNPDRVAADELDATVRGLLDELNLADTKAEIAALKDGDPGNVERDLAAIARMAIKGGVDTYWFDFTAPVQGTLDLTTGELSYADVATAATAAGVSDLLARVAHLVQESGGRVVAVRGSDLDETWQGPALARLRFSLA